MTVGTSTPAQLWWRWTSSDVARMLSHAVAGWPLLHGVIDAVRGDLTANPIQAVTVRTGYAALACLVASLVVTPLAVIGRQTWAVPSRRALGLWAFAYASMHLATFVVLDYGLDWTQIWQTVVEKRYILAGLTSFLAMVPLAVTSTRGWQFRLRQNWRRLHRLAYVAAVASVVHFAWLVKADVREPIAWIVGLALLFAMRLPQVRRRLTAVVSRATRRSVARERGATPVSVP